MSEGGPRRDVSLTVVSFSLQPRSHSGGRYQWLHRVTDLLSGLLLGLGVNGFLVSGFSHRFSLRIIGRGEWSEIRRSTAAWFWVSPSFCLF